MVLKKDSTGTYGHKGKWLLLSKSIGKNGKRKVLKIFGPKKPTKEEFNKEERRIQWFKHH